MVTWGSLACRLKEMWPMTVSTVSIKPSTMALSCRRHGVKELSGWSLHDHPPEAHWLSTQGLAPHCQRQRPLRKKNAPHLRRPWRASLTSR